MPASPIIRYLILCRLNIGRSFTMQDGPPGPLRLAPKPCFPSLQPAPWIRGYYCSPLGLSPLWKLLGTTRPSWASVSLFARAVPL